MSKSEWRLDRLKNLIRRIWIRARLVAPPLARRAIIPYLHSFKEVARLLIRPYLPIYQLRGQGKGGTLSVIYSGLGFAKPFLKDILFLEEPVEQKIGQVPFWRHDKFAEFRSSDIIIVHAAERLIRKLPLENALVLPHYVHHTLNVRGDWQDLRGRFHKSVRKNELRFVRKYGYEYEKSHDYQNLEIFYYRMYLPTMKARHGKRSSPLSFKEAYQYFRHGCLFRVMRDGNWVSGVICHFQQSALVADIMGVKNANEDLIHEGAASTLYYAMVHWANQNGYETVNLLGTNPLLKGGRFQYKRKWGASVSMPSDLHRWIWIKVAHITPVVSRFLKENPLILVDQDRKLHGFIVVDDLNDVSAETRDEWEKLYVTPGLRSLLIRQVSCFAQESSNTQASDLVIPIAHSSDSEVGDDYEMPSLS